MSYAPQKIISENRKTSCSINLPMAGHCTPTKNCAASCYAKSGPMALPSNKRKQHWVSEYLKGTDLTQLASECRRWTAVRLSGSGDLLPDHVPAILKLAKACPKTIFWGMTRKVAVAKALNKKLPNLKLLVSIDATSPQTTLKYKGPVCFGPRLPGDVVPDLPNLITVFPYHQGGQVRGVSRHPKDCKAVWHENTGCIDCNKCWNF